MFYSRLIVVIIAVAVLIMPCSSFALSSKEGGYDSGHFMLGTVSGVVSEMFLYYKTDWSPVARIASATVMGTIPSAINEFAIDESQSNNESNQDDLLSAIAGAFVGSLVSAIYNENINVDVRKDQEMTKVSILYNF